jgi:hypothetical protein
MVSKMKKQDMTTRIINAYHKKKTLKTVKDYLWLMDFMGVESNGYIDALIYADKHYPSLSNTVANLTLTLIRKAR